jgi:hypothetical protein
MVGGMTTSYGPMAERLLARIEASHAALIAYTGADDKVCDALRGLHAVLAAGLGGLSEDQILATPSPDEWSMAEVLDHVAEHDTKYEEFRRLGVDHYVEHGLEHALQLWRLRPVGPR